MFKVQLFLKSGHSMGYLHFRGKNCCLGASEKKAKIFSQEEFEKIKINPEYKIRKEIK